MAAKIQKSCATVLRSVRSCNLNYACQETPFYIYLTIRKSWSKITQVHDEPAHQVSELVQKHCNKDHEAEENRYSSLKTKLAGVETQLNTSKQIISELESKADRTEAVVMNHFKETKQWKEILDQKDKEKKLLKNSILSLTISRGV